MRSSWLDGLLCREDCAIIMKEKTSETKNMKIVVLGGTGLIGSKVVNHPSCTWPRSRCGISFAGHQFDYRRRFN